MTPLREVLGLHVAIVIAERAVGAFSASMVPAASRALQARQSSWHRPRRLPLGCRTHPGLAASLPPPRVALRTPQRPILLYMILYIGGGHTAGCAVLAFVCLQ